jgi:hypothetical protein
MGAFFDVKVIHFGGKDMAKHDSSVYSRILKTIEDKDAGFVFTPNYFTDIGSRDAIASALKRYKQAGLIRQVSRGIYEKPRQRPDGRASSPSVDAIIAALRERDAVRLQPAGAYAANLLGLSEQVPTKLVVLTDGPTHHVNIDGQHVIFKHTTPRAMATAGRKSGLVIQALKHMGQHSVTGTLVKHLRRNLSRDEKKQLTADMRYAPAWIANVMRQVAGRQRIIG